jgi:hypothetical protein
MIHGEMPVFQLRNATSSALPAERDRGEIAGNPLAGDAPGQVDGELGGLSPCRRCQVGLAQVPVLGEHDAWRDQLGQLPSGHVVGVGDREHLRVCDGGGVDRDVPQDGQVRGRDRQCGPLRQSLSTLLKIALASTTPRNRGVSEQYRSRRMLTRIPVTCS